MAKILRFDPSRRRQTEEVSENSCAHKEVVAFTASRTVECTVCGTKLDPFYVMVELLKGSKPPGDIKRELKLYTRELERRHQKKEPKGK